MNALLDCDCGALMWLQTMLLSIACNAQRAAVVWAVLQPSGMVLGASPQSTLEDKTSLTSDLLEDSPLSAASHRAPCLPADLSCSAWQSEVPRRQGLTGGA